MSKTIFAVLEKGIDKEIDKMPYGLTKRQYKRLVNKALVKVIKTVGRQYGIPNADTDGIKDVFWTCRQSFPDFDDEAYTSMMRGDSGKSIVELGRFEYLKANRKRENKGFKNDILFDGEWGANYNPSKHEMLGGYSEDGEQFHPDFRIRDVEEDDVPNALAICSLLYAKYGMIDTTFEELQKEFSETFKEA